MASGKRKSIDNMNISEVTTTMEALGISFEGLETFMDEMKSRLLAELSQAAKTPSWSTGQVQISITV